MGKMIMRKLKVQSVIVPSQRWMPMKIKPLLKLQGDWLREYGFEPGMKVQISNPEKGIVKIISL